MSSEGRLSRMLTALTVGAGLWFVFNEPDARTLQRRHAKRAKPLRRLSLGVSTGRTAATLSGWKDITPKMRARAKKVLQDWQHHKRPFEDMPYWEKRFSNVEDVLAHTRPTGPITLYRSERTDIDNKYGERFTSWSRDADAVDRFGWGERRLVTATFRPEDVLVDFVNAGLDTEAMREVIVRPGKHDIKRYKSAFDRYGLFNAYEEPDRARAAGFKLDGLSSRALGRLPPRVSNEHAAKALRKIARKAKRCGITLQLLREGMQVELEHRDVTQGGLLKTAKIAAAHLCEHPGYYRGLQQMERKLSRRRK